MEKYETITVVGEGSYGVVIKCRHRDTNQIVAIKKFLETEEDNNIRRMAMREIRMLKKLRHENLVMMIEVFRYRKRYFLVFEYLEGTVLDELEKFPGGLGHDRSRERIYQVLRAINYCHMNHIMHRDVKPENVLVSSRGVVKLCDFGFARVVGGSGEPYTDYVATRWYRAPELLVGETHYGAPVDIWAIGCLFAEMMTGEPLFPGDSDIDQLFRIVKLIGKLCPRHQQLVAKNNEFRAVKFSSAVDSTNLHKIFPTWSGVSVDFVICSMRMDPLIRHTAEQLLKHNLFTQDRFDEKFLPALREKVKAEFGGNPLIRRFKSDILIPEMKKEEIRPKRLTDVPKWKLNLSQTNNVKRKFSSEAVITEDHKTVSNNNQHNNHQNVAANANSSNNNNCVLTSNKNNVKLSQLQKQTQFSKNNSIPSLKRSDDKNGGNAISNILIQNSRTSGSSVSLAKFTKEDFYKISFAKENPRLEKALEILAKLNSKPQLRPKSTSKDVIAPLTPPEFQSLQSHSFREPAKSPAHSLLQPSITNITFKDKPPPTLNTLNNISLRSMFHQVPLTNPTVKPVYLKKLDRNVIVDTTIPSDGPKLGSSPPDWLSSIGLAQKKRETWKGKSTDDFTLPTVPGGSTTKSKSVPTSKYPSLIQLAKNYDITEDYEHKELTVKEVTAAGEIIRKITTKTQIHKIRTSLSKKSKVNTKKPKCICPNTVSLTYKIERDGEESPYSDETNSIPFPTPGHKSSFYSVYSGETVEESNGKESKGPQSKSNPGSARESESIVKFVNYSDLKSQTSPDIKSQSEPIFQNPKSVDGASNAVPNGCRSWSEYSRIPEKPVSPPRIADIIFKKSSEHLRKNYTKVIVFDPKTNGIPEWAAKSKRIKKQCTHCSKVRDELEKTTSCKTCNNPLVNFLVLPSISATASPTKSKKKQTPEQQENTDSSPISPPSTSQKLIDLTMKPQFEDRT